MQWVLVVPALLLQRVEVLKRVRYGIMHDHVVCSKLTEGNCSSHSRHRSRSCRIQAGCCEACPFAELAAATSSSSSLSIRILRSFPRSSFPETI